MKNLVVRTITGIFYVAAVVCSIIFYDVFPYAFEVLFLLFTGIGAYELLRMAKQLDYHPQWVMGLLIPIALYVSISTGFANLIVILAAAVLLAFPIEVFRNQPHPIANVAVTLLPSLWVALPFSLLLLLINEYPEAPLAMFIIIWLNDTLAYCVGSLFGKHKLCERISPKKSIEGFAGALVLTAALSLTFYFIPYFNGSRVHHWCWWIGFAVVVILFGTVGDLVESLFKRDCGVKDSGKILPGHGGVLDRMDSALLAIPAAMLYLYLFY